MPGSLIALGIELFAILLPCGEEQAFHLAGLGGGLDRGYVIGPPTIAAQDRPEHHPRIPEGIVLDRDALGSEVAPDEQLQVDDPTPRPRPIDEDREGGHTSEHRREGTA